MYNVIKGQGAAGSQDEKRKVIDSNERMNQIIEAQKRELERLAEERRMQIIDDYLESLEPDEEGRPVLPMDEDGNVLLPVDDDGTQLLYVHSDGFLYEDEEEIIEEPPEEIVEEEPEPVVEEPPIDREAILAEIQQEADAILADANEKASGIVSKAEEDAEALTQKANAAVSEAEELKAKGLEEGRNTGHEEGFQQGYDEGLKKANEELLNKSKALEEDFAKRKAEFEAKEAEFEAEAIRLGEEYKQKEAGFEKQMGEVFCDVIGKVFHIEFSDKQEIILHLVDNLISNTPGSKEYMVRVNEHNYDILNENRERLIEKVGSGIGIDIIKDPLLTDEECQIETDGGVYDCGMDVQLNNLLKDLKALSLV